MSFSSEYEIETKITISEGETKLKTKRDNLGYMICKNILTEPAEKQNFIIFTKEYEHENSINRSYFPKNLENFNLDKTLTDKEERDLENFNLDKYSIDKEEEEEEKDSEILFSLSIDDNEEIVVQNSKEDELLKILFMRLYNKASM